MDTIITNATGYSSVEYSRLLEQAVKEGRLSRAVLERNVRSVISTMLKRV